MCTLISQISTSRHHCDQNVFHSCTAILMVYHCISEETIPYVAGECEIYTDRRMQWVNAIPYALFSSLHGPTAFTSALICFVYDPAVVNTVLQNTQLCDRRWCSILWCRKPHEVWISYLRCSAIHHILIINIFLWQLCGEVSCLRNY